MKRRVAHRPLPFETLMTKSDAVSRPQYSADVAQLILAPRISIILQYNRAQKNFFTIENQR